MTSVSLISTIYLTMPKTQDLVLLKELREEERQLEKARTQERIRVALEQAAHDREYALQPFDDEAQVHFLRLLASGMPVFDICRFLKVSRSTAYYVKRENPEFESKWLDALEMRVTPVEDRLRDIAEAGDPTSMATVRAAEVLLKGNIRRYNQAPRMPAVSASIQQGGSEGPRFTMTLGQPTPE